MSGHLEFTICDLREECNGAVITQLLRTICTLPLALPLLILAGCQSFESPGLSLKDARFAEGPIIVQRGEHFYLRYRRDVEDGHYPLLSALWVKKAKDAGYYFFGVPISHTEWGELVERPLAYDGLEEFARRGQIFWLDPDGTKHPIPVRPDA